jgi:uncharacterized membrane protein YoaK (UPF0700 family)
MGASRGQELVGRTGTGLDWSGGRPESRFSAFGRAKGPALRGSDRGGGRLSHRLITIWVVSGRRWLERFLLGSLGPRNLRRWVARLFAFTLRLIPLDPHLLTSHHDRTKHLNRQLAWSLAFVAGAVNAGGYLAVELYTSHVTGAVAKISDQLVLGNSALALEGVGIVCFFGTGAFFSTLLISYGRRHRFKSHYALSLMIEALLLVVFGLIGARLSEIHGIFVPATVMLLSFMMGMHNSMVTTISNAEVRTSHMTGIVTDLGIELGRLFYFNRSRDTRVPPIRANRDKLKLHSLILGSFFAGGLFGALSFKYVGFKMALFLAAYLAFLAIRPILHDLRVRWRLIQLSRTDS